MKRKKGREKERKEERKEGERMKIAAYTPLWHTLRKGKVKNEKRKNLRNFIKVPLLRGVLVLTMCD